MVIGLPLAAGGAGAAAAVALPAALAAGEVPPGVAAAGFDGAVFEAAPPHAASSPISSQQASRRAIRSESIPPPCRHLARRLQSSSELTVQQAVVRVSAVRLLLTRSRHDVPGRPPSGAALRAISRCPRRTDVRVALACRLRPRRVTTGRRLP